MVAGADDKFSSACLKNVLEAQKVYYLSQLVRLYVSTNTYN